MKADYSTKKRLGVLPWVLIILIGAYILEKIFLTITNMRLEQSALMLNIALSTEAFKSGKIWTLFTYAFLHDDNTIFHILSNLLGIFFIGRMVVKIFGEKVFLDTLIISTITGGLVYLLFHFSSNGLVVGASAAAMGLLAVFCLARPDEHITLLLYFIIPITLKPKWVLWGTTAISLMGLLFTEIPRGSGIAHSAHLGGLVGGFIYYQMISKGKTLKGFRIKNPFGKTTATPPPKPKVKRPSYTVNIESKDKMRKEVDRILDKINTHGFGSLTIEERRVLDQAKDLLKK